jgi:hypothetical protein
MPHSSDKAATPAASGDALRDKIEQTERIRNAYRGSSLGFGEWLDHEVELLNNSATIAATPQPEPAGLDVERLAVLVRQGMLILQRERGRLSKVTDEDVATLLRGLLAALQPASREQLPLSPVAES